ncbi:MAG: TolC family protein [Candidatus Neomarinimicrobiota bacterium]
MLALWPPPAKAAPGPQLPHSIEALFQYNKAILAAGQTMLAARRRVAASGLLPDPAVEATGFLRPIQTRDGPMESQIMLGQRFPLWGTLRRERGVAALRAEMSAEDLQQLKVEAVFQLNQHWARYLRLTRSLEILGEYRSGLGSFRQAALAHYSTGGGLTQHPILKLQIEMSLVESQMNTLSSELESAVNGLQALYDGHFSPEVVGEDGEIVLPGPSAEEWLERAEGGHPLLVKARQRRQIATLRHELAVRKAYPNLVAGVTYTAVGPTELAGAVSPGGDALGIKLGLNLPLWFRGNRARVGAALSEVDAQLATIEDTWNGIERDVRSAKKQLDELQATHRLYSESLLREAEQMLSSAHAAYETDRISFLDLLDSERMVKQVRLDFEAVKADRRIARARLLRAAGLYLLEEE